MKSRSLFCAALAVLLLLLSACGHPAPEASGAAAEGLSATDTITPEEGVAILEKQLGAVDEATGNVMSYGRAAYSGRSGLLQLPGLLAGGRRSPVLSHQLSGIHRRAGGPGVPAGDGLIAK